MSAFIEATTIIFLLLLLGVFFVKLINLLKAGQLYEAKFILVGWIAATVFFAFILINVLHSAATSVEYVSYLWLVVPMYLVCVFLTIGEAIAVFTQLFDKGPRDRLYIERGRR